MTADTTTGPATGDVLELLGLVSYTALAVFEQVAADAAHAPSLQARQDISVVAADVLHRQRRVLDRITELGGDPAAQMALFDGVYDDFDARTKPSSWWEGLLKGFVGHAIAQDFCRIAARGLDTPDHDIVVDALSMEDADEVVADGLAQAAASDAVLASRLALWGRRLVGEALGVVQGVVGEHPALGRLVAAGEAAAPEPSETEPARPKTMFGQLTAAHSRRMSRLGLTA